MDNFGGGGFNWPITKRNTHIVSIPPYRRLYSLSLLAIYIGCNGSNLGQSIWDKMWCYLLGPTWGPYGNSNRLQWVELGGQAYGIKCGAIYGSNLRTTWELQEQEEFHWTLWNINKVLIQPLIFDMIFRWHYNTLWRLINRCITMSLQHHIVINPYFTKDLSLNTLLKYYKSTNTWKDKFVKNIRF